MDPWLTDQLKEVLFMPCLEASSYIGERLDNRRTMDQNIDERALTEDLVDFLDSSSLKSVWGRVATKLNDQGLYLNTTVRKSTNENIIGADIGLIIERSVYSSRARYAALIQCKKVDNDGVVKGFYHAPPKRVLRGGEGQISLNRESLDSQSSLMLDITPSSFYFIFTPPSLVEVLTNTEPAAFAVSSEGCRSRVWNMGHFDYDSPHSLPVLSSIQRAAAIGILVVPALAVEAQRSTRYRVSLREILPNCVPFWYWFGELLVPGFVGDRSSYTIDVASNITGPSGPGRVNPTGRYGVRYSISVGVGSG